MNVVCEHADRCGGCPLIGSPYADQLAQKHARVEAAVARYPGLGLVKTDPVMPADPIVGYRTRAKLIVAPGPRIGLYARGGGHDVIDIPRCRVLAPGIAGVAEKLRAQIAAAEQAGGLLAPLGPTGCGALRAVDIREVQDGAVARVLVTFVVDGARVTDLVPLRQAAEALVTEAPEVVGVAANFHEGDGPQILGSRTVPLAGAPSAADRIGASLHLATFGSFVQAHRGQAARVHALVARSLGLGARPAGGPAPRVLDLYGGSGAIALGLAAAGASVHLVESFPPAVAQATEAARTQSLDMTAECGDVAAALRALCRGGARFDAAVLNPPRRGTSPAAREWLARLAPRLIAYVACDPDTLTRDLDHLARLGYTPAALQPVDMIPLTEEVETVAILRRTGVPAARVVYEDDRILVVDKGPHEPTMPQGEYAGSLLGRLRLIAGAERAVPVHRLDVGAGGLVLFVRRPGDVDHWARALAAPSARKAYLVAVRGIASPQGAITRRAREGGATREARTRYRRLAIASRHSLLRILPDQDRGHQIRRHLAAIGHPVLGDERYGDPATNRHLAEKYGLDRPFLHCARLEFEHPGTGSRHIVEAPLGGDLRAVLERIGGTDALRSLDQDRGIEND